MEKSGAAFLEWYSCSGCLGGINRNANIYSVRICAAIDIQDAPADLPLAPPPPSDSSFAGRGLPPIIGEVELC